MTLLATQLGGGVILGTLEASYHYGLYSILYGLGLSIGLIILSLGIGARFRRLDVYTIAEIFEKIYDSKRLRQASALISVVSLFLILVAICLSSEKLFTSLGFENKALFLALWLGTTYYTIMGGFKAVVKTDVVQVSFILLTFIILAFYFFWNPGHLPSINISENLKNSGNIPLLSWLISPLFFVIIGQDMGQRCFSAYSEKTVSRACLYAGLLLFFCSLLPGLMGVYIKMMGLIPTEKEPLLLLALKVIQQPMLGSLFIASVLMAILSTADSLLCAITSHISEDFSFTEIKTQKQKIFIARLVTFIVSLLALFLASFVQEIISLMVLAYEICINTLFVPIIFSILLKNPKKEQATISMITGLVCFISLKFMPIFPGKELFPILLAALAFVLTKTKLSEK